MRWSVSRPSGSADETGRRSTAPARLIGAALLRLPPMTKQPNGHVCLWCGNGFTPRRDGGKPQVYCREACRRSLDAAGRRWVAEAIASGMLTVDALRNGPGVTRALLPGAISPPPIDEPSDTRSCSASGRLIRIPE